MQNIGVCTVIGMQKVSIISEIAMNGVVDLTSQNLKDPHFQKCKI